VTGAARNLFASAALVASAAGAGAKQPGGVDEGVYRFPSDDIPLVANLKSAVQDSRVKVIVVAKGEYDVGTTPIFIAARDDLLICGATGDPKDVVFTAGQSSVVFVQEARRISFRSVTLSTSASFGAAVFLNATPSSDRESYVEDVTLERCALSGYEGIGATVGARNLVVTRCRFTVTATNGQGGAGVFWADGPGLFVSRSRFTTADDAPSVAAVFVQGALAVGAEGGRARQILLLGNSVSGDFTRGFDLADVVEARIRSNSVSFPGPRTEADVAGTPAGSGRVGLLIRRANASSLTEDYEVFRNRVRGAYYGAWLVNASSGAVRRNDFRRCGSTARDPAFEDDGGALRLNLAGGVCRVAVERNDFRALRTPTSEPAVSVFPVGAEDLCFSGDEGNRVDKGRELYLGENP
jgi:hypothetical protein